jgi:DNA-3-methyladenine glycosylase
MRAPPQTRHTTKLLPRAFYNRSPETVARALLGKLLIRNLHGERLTGRIIEVEAYLGPADPASHTARGLTPTNAVLFGPSGHAYVYFIYGMYYCLNVSCHLEGKPGGVLIQALDPIDGLETMARLRGLPAHSKHNLLTGGPGRLCQAFGITRKTDNGIDVTSANSTIQIADDGTRPGKIQVTPRIGIRKAADLPLRFLIDPIAKDKAAAKTLSNSPNSPSS